MVDRRLTTCGFAPAWARGRGPRRATLPINGIERPEGPFPCRKPSGAGRIAAKVRPSDTRMCEKDRPRITWMCHRDGPARPNRPQRSGHREGSVFMR